MRMFFVAQWPCDIIVIVGSAKSMEPSMGVELTKQLAGGLELDSTGGKQSTEYSVDNTIMDGDTRTTSRIHENVSKEIGVWSDVGHAKKALYGHLIRLSTTHKSMSKTVTDYLCLVLWLCPYTEQRQPRGHLQAMQKHSLPCIWGSQFLWWHMVPIPQESSNLPAPVTATWQGP